jgi:fibronectin type 3 domain-containing protein
MVWDWRGISGWTVNFLLVLTFPQKDVKMEKRYAAFLVPFVLFLLAGCTRQDGKASRLNPFDPNGTNWTIDSKPHITALIDSLPLWDDFDFSENTGSVSCRVRITDNNGKYDTLRTTVLIGTLPNPTDTVRTFMDSAYVAGHLKSATNYYYSITVRDKWDSSATVNGSFTTPAGPPPRMTDSIIINGGYSYISLNWYNADYNATYLIYRSDSPSGPFHLIADTMVTKGYSNGFFADYVNDYKSYYYRMSALNGNGECKSKKILFGYIYSSGVSAPYSLSASQGNYADYIYLNWYVNNSNGTFFIHRSPSPNGMFSIIDSTRESSYRDTVMDAGVYYYYQVSVRDALGRRSAPSSYTYGYTSLLGSPNLSASQGAYYSYISLSWYSVSYAAGYYLYRSLSSSGPFTCIDTIASAGNSYSDIYYKDSVKTTDTYYYKVAAYAGSGKAGSQSAYAASGYLQRPSAPTVSVSKGSSFDYIPITWSGNPTAKKYFIYRAFGSSLTDSMRLIDSTIATVHSYYDSVKTEGNYYYSISMLDTGNRISALCYPDYGYLGSLTAPVSIQATTSFRTAIRVTWSPVASAAGYYIYRSASSTGPFQKIDSTEAAVYNDSAFIVDTQAVASINYYYKIQAFSASKKSGPLSAYAIGALQGFLFPANIKATTYANKSKIFLTWDTVNQATGYSVYRSVLFSGPFVKLASVTRNGYTDTMTSGNIVYYYTVTSLKGAKESNQSSPVKGAVLFPPVLGIAKSTTTSITIALPALGDTAIKGFFLYRSTDSLNFVRLLIISPSVINAYINPVVDDQVVDGKVYYYKLSSFSNYDESNYSNCIVAQLLPPVPQNIKVSINSGAAFITWDSVPYAQAYRIYRGAGAGSIALSLFNVVKSSQISDVDSSIKNFSIYYYYAVAAVNQGGEGGKSSIISVQFSSNPPVAPQNFSASGTAFGISLSWTKPSSIVDSSILYRSLDSGKTFSKLTLTTGSTYFDSVTSGILYFYEISAINSAGEGTKSSSVSSKRLAPVAPTNFNELSSPTSVTISWIPPEGATGYTIYRSQSLTATFEKLGQIADPSYTDTTAQNGITYYYKITASNPAGESAMSDYIPAMAHD